MVGVAGRNAMLEALHRNLEGKAASNRTIRILAIKGPLEGQNCQAVYLAEDHRGRLKQLLTGLKAQGTLVFGESNTFLDLGGTVNLILLQGHMSFEVSQEALDRAGIAISSKLLRYGQVRSRPPERGPITRCDISWPF